MNEKDLRRVLDETMARSVFPDSGKQEILQRMNGGKPIMKKKLSLGLVCALVLMLLTCTALAATLLSRNVLEPFVGPVSEETSQFIQRDLAKVSYAHCDVEIREAAYDGMSLYILYSIRDRNATEPWENLDEATRNAYLEAESFPAMEADGIGWWKDALWINGQPINMPGNSVCYTYLGQEPGELLFYQMYRLDQEGIRLSGDAVEIALPVGTRGLLTSGSIKPPESGVITFTLNADTALSHTLIQQPQAAAVVTDKVVASVSQVDYTPLQTYITLSLQAREGALDAFVAEYGPGPLDENGQLLYPYTDQFVFGGWVDSLVLVDETGTPLFPEVSGCNGYSDTWAEFVYPHMETIPDALYLAPMVDGQARMAEAIRVR